MPKKKNEFEPNYKLQLENHIFTVQTAYRDWKRAMKDYLDASWIGMDGTICYTNDFLELAKEAENLHKEFDKEVIILNEFRKKHPELKGD